MKMMLIDLQSNIASFHIEELESRRSCDSVQTDSSILQFKRVHLPPGDDLSCQARALGKRCKKI